MASALAISQLLFQGCAGSFSRLRRQLPPGGSLSLKGDQRGAEWSLSLKGDQRGAEWRLSRNASCFYPFACFFLIG